MMKAAVVSREGQTPVFSEFKKPVARDGETLISVRASAVSQLARLRASGKHYSFEGIYPFVAGVDGVGTTPDGRRVYFLLPTAPSGAFAKLTTVRNTNITPLPDSLSDTTAAAIINPGMSSWLALGDRAHIQKGETVLINGATGASGQLAIQIARLMGASRVIVTGRNESTLAMLVSKLGADHAVSLTQPPEALAAALGKVAEEGVDIVLDYLYGSSASAILHALSHTKKPWRRVRYVQIGEMCSDTIALKASQLRSCAVELIGSGLGSVPPARLMGVCKELLDAAGPAGLTIETEVASVGDVESEWERDVGSKRLVFTLDAAQ